MVAIRIQAFGGMQPAIDDRLLPDNAAAEARNTWLYDGKLAGLRVPRLIHTLSTTNKRAAYRIPKGGTGIQNIVDSYWLEFDAIGTTVVKGNVGASDQRFYWADGTNPPRYTARSLIFASPSSPTTYKLGVPAPTAPPTVVIAGGVSATNESRAYVFTHVTSFGEEGPPSPPSTVQTGKIDATWTLTIPAVGADATDRDITHTRIYRTITSDQGVANYYYVGQVTVATLSYADSALPSTIVLNDVMTCADYDPPPTDLEGMVEMPNGMVIGWKETQIWFCEPYKPHAWPTPYQRSTDFKIKGIGVYGQSAVICTEGVPYTCTGSHPADMVLAKVVGLTEPCVSQGSVVSAPEGVYYASQSGLVLVSPGSGQLATYKLIQKDRWQHLLNVARLNAAFIQRSYVTFSGIGEGCFEIPAFESTAFEETDFTGTRNGAMIDFDDPRIGFTILTSVDPTYNVMRDPWTNELFFIRGNEILWLDTTADIEQGEYFWRSKVYQMPRMTNMAAGRIFFENPTGVTSPTTTLRVYGNGNLIFTYVLEASGKEFRLPANDRYDFYQFELQGTLLIQNAQFATSFKELRAI